MNACVNVDTQFHYWSGHRENVSSFAHSPGISAEQTLFSGIFLVSGSSKGNQTDRSFFSVRLTATNFIWSLLLDRVGYSFPPSKLH